MGYYDFITANQVDGPEALIKYIRQATGAPPPTVADFAQVRKKCKAFFKEYPHLNYVALCHVADWCKSKKYRFSHPWKVLDMYRYAYADGALPEMDLPPSDPNLDQQIYRALQMETDPDWRLYLKVSSGTTQKEVLDAWEINRKPILAAL